MASFLASLLSILLFAAKFAFSYIVLQDFYSSTDENLLSLQTLQFANISTPADFGATVGELTWQKSALISEMVHSTNKVPMISSLSPSAGYNGDHLKHSSNKTVKQKQTMDLYFFRIHDVNRNASYTGDLVPFYGSYEDLINEILLNNSDATVGDIQITANRIHDVKNMKSNMSWVFLKTVNRGLWLLMAALTVSTFCVVWIFEHRVNSDFCSSGHNHIERSLWSTFSKVMFENGEPIWSRFLCFTLSPWSFLVLIVTSTYTQNFSLMLTNLLLEPTKNDTGLLKRANVTLLLNSLVEYNLTESGSKQLKTGVPSNSTITEFVKLFHDVDFYGYSFGGDASYFHWTSDREETDVKRVKIAVSANSIFEQFVKVIHDDNRNITYIGGFSVHVFESAAKYLQYTLIYNWVPFYGSHDDLIKQVSLNNFDAAIGDILITANRNQPVEFSQPYIETNLVMIVKTTKPNIWQQFWMFLQPLSKGVWLLMAALTVSTCFVVWILEHRVNSDGTSFWSTFSTVMFAHGEPIRSQWSRFVLVPWIFLVLIITSTYTANFSAMLTNPVVQSTEIDIELLKRTNASVGCDGNSFTVWYLKNILHFKEDNIKRISSKDEFANSLSNGSIRAAFMLSPQARVFVSEYCQFALSGPKFKLGGFGYVFPRGSPFALDFSEAIIYLKQSGELQQLEDEKLSGSKCINSEPDSRSKGVGIAPFAGLFIILGCVSVVALIVAAIRQFQIHWERFAFTQTMWICKSTLWPWVVAFFAPNKERNEIELSTETCNSANRINNT